jgi:hypothetical protein
MQIPPLSFLLCGGCMFIKTRLTGFKTQSASDGARVTSCPRKTVFTFLGVLHRELKEALLSLGLVRAADCKFFLGRTFLSGNPFFQRRRHIRSTLRQTAAGYIFTSFN